MKPMCTIYRKSITRKWKWGYQMIILQELLITVFSTLCFQPTEMQLWSWDNEIYFQTRFGIGLLSYNWQKNSGSIALPLIKVLYNDLDSFHLYRQVWSNDIFAIPHLYNYTISKLKETVHICCSDFFFFRWKYWSVQRSNWPKSGSQCMGNYSTYI